MDVEVRHALKVLKAIGDKAKRQYEDHLYMALMLRTDLIARKGEAWHQLGLRSEERVDYAQAAERYAKAKSSLNASKQPLAFARVLRDEAWLQAYRRGEIGQGLELVNEALAHHERDLSRARSQHAKKKGRRQELITQTYVWRIQYLATDSQDVLNELIRVIEHEGREFCERDQLNIIKFLIPIPQVGIEERLRLELRASQLNNANSSLLALPYRTTLRSITFGLSSLRWLSRSIREG